MDKDYIQQYEDLELRHWWFVARRELIHDWLTRYVFRDLSSEARWLDVGCGTGVLLDSYPAIRQKMGLELDSTCVQRAHAKGLDVRQSPENWNLAPLGTFDIVTMCDVLEHLSDEAPALDAVHHALSDNGKLLVTVPALPTLWSGHDAVNHHYRRYVQRTLLQCFDSSRWVVERASYFSSLLLPVIWSARKIKNMRARFRGSEPTHDFSVGPRTLDWLPRIIFRQERWLLRHIRLPVGSSLILVARKRATR
jgi:SAM-dependent methyltransferase